MAGGDVRPLFGELIDLRDGLPEHVAPNSEEVIQPEFVERWENPFYFRTSVYNLEVEDFHTYYVDSLPIWAAGLTIVPLTRQP